MSKPLAGIKVVEFGQNLAGPYCGQILAFLGAEVVKVERPEGDDARKWGPPFIEGDSVGFIALNRGKKSITCDLGDKAQREALIERIGAADVFIHNLRADVPAKFGIDGATLTRRFPRLIYADLGAFGHAGPWKERPGYEPIIQAVAGLISLNGDPSGPEARIGVSIIDLSTGMWTAIGVLAAIAQRAATGRGSLVNTSLFESGLMWASNHAANYSVTGRMAARQGTGHPSLTPYQAFECSDGPLDDLPGQRPAMAQVRRGAGPSRMAGRAALQDQRRAHAAPRPAAGHDRRHHEAQEPRLLVGQARCAGRAQRAAQHRAAGAGACPGGGTRHVRPALRRLETRCSTACPSASTANAPAEVAKAPKIGEHNGKV